MSQRTHIDWLALRSKASPEVTEGALKRIFGQYGQWTHLSPRGRGWQGYESSSDIRIADMNVGLVAFGGTKQRGWCHASISGSGCQWVENWDDAQEVLEALPGHERRRVDIALDTHRREVTHENVVNAYRSGGFTTRGRPPSCTRIESERPGDGRTVYVGTRTSDKFFRGYEKGLQLLAGSPDRGTTTHIEGVPVEDMYRCELELKAKTAPLPVDLIDRRDQYFAGSYPYLQALLSDVEPELLVMRRERGPQLQLAAALETIRHQYGRTLFTALTAYHGDIGRLVSKIVGRQHNVDLLRAGALLVEHE